MGMFRKIKKAINNRLHKKYRMITDAAIAEVMGWDMPEEYRERTMFYVAYGMLNKRDIIKRYKKSKHNG